jgi:glycine/D-amino acid oxidase-like deaminating enzyme
LIRRIHLQKGSGFSMARFDVVVIGAGIVGAACARECARAGLRTAVIDGGTAGAATAAAMGHVVVLDDSAAQFALSLYSRGLWHEDREAMQAAEVESRAPGTLWLATNDEENSLLRTRGAEYAQAGVAVELLDGMRLTQLEPNLRSGLAGALWVQDDLVCDPPAAAAFYLGEALREGATVFRSRAVAAADGSVELADGTQLDAARIVLATGVACELMPALPIRRRKGHLLITEPRPGFLARQIIELGYLTSAHSVEQDSVAFNVQPRPDGSILIGASRQYGNEDPRVDQHIVEQLRACAQSFMPALAAVPTASIRVGFRPASPDKLPIIGPAARISDDSTMWLCAGFEGLGITCAPGAARLLADGLLGRVSAIDQTPYLASRFAQEKA